MSFNHNNVRLRHHQTTTFAQLRSDKNQLFLLDGGTGEELFRRGVPNDRTIWSAIAIVDPAYHDTVKQVHASFIEAGSQAITTNSYGFGMVFQNVNELQQHLAKAGELANESAGDKEDVIVLGSLGPLVESYRPDKILNHDLGVERYSKMKGALMPYVDAFLVETMSSFEESTQAIEAVGGDLPLLVSYTLDSNGNLRSKELVTFGISRLLDFTALRNVDLFAVLFNCTEPEAITMALQEIKTDLELTKRLSMRGVLLGAYANCLTPVAPDWSLQESDGPQPMRNDLDPGRYYSEFVKVWVQDFNVQLIGGCCGITPEHINFLREKLQRGANEKHL